MRKYEVDIDLANETKREMASEVNSADPRVLNKFGAFASLFNPEAAKYKDPILVLKTEEPGSKQLLAMEYDRIENVSYDMINHLINDCIVMGATPLSVQDAIICGKLDKQIVKRIVGAVAAACKAQGCVLTGGETSEQPGVLGEGVYILTSSIVGIAERSEIIDGSQIKEGDVVISLASSGIHTNGYTLVRKTIKDHPEILQEKADGRDFIEAVLEPHRCYYSAIKDLFKTGWIKGMAHITGGGIKENLNRILPADVDAAIDLGNYRIPQVFDVVRRYGNVADEEMLRTFNLGVGLCLVVSAEKAAEVQEAVINNGIDAYVIGQITAGSGKVQCSGTLPWEA